MQLDKYTSRSLPELWAELEELTKKKNNRLGEKAKSEELI